MVMAMRGSTMAEKRIMKKPIHHQHPFAFTLSFHISYCSHLIDCVQDEAVLVWRRVIYAIQYSVFGGKDAGPAGD